jgi:hypothetical protein
MATARDLLGVWRGEAMFAPDSQTYEVLVFHMDGTGFLDLYVNGRGGDERFCWSLAGPDELHLTGDPLPRFDLTGQLIPRPPMDVRARLEVIVEPVGPQARVRMLRLASPSWPGASDRYRFGSEAMYALFRAPAFEAEDEPADRPFRGRLVSDHLADALRARGAEVGEMRRVFFGACYYRTVEVNGHCLGLAVNWDQELGRWWLRVDPPEQGVGDEVEALCRMIRPVLEPAPGLTDLEWLTADEMDRCDHERGSTDRPAGIKE